MYRVHRHYTSMMLNDTVQHMKALRNDLDYSNFRLPMDEQRLLATRKQIPAAYKPNHLNEVSAWKAFGTDSIYSLAAGEVTSDITNDILADLKQIGETGIDEAIGFPQQQFTYSHVSDGYVRSDPVRGTDYLLDVYFNSRTDGVSDEIRRVHLVRPLDEVEVTHTRRQSSTDKDGATSFHIILPISKSRGSDLDVFMRNQFEPGFLSSTSVRANLVVVPLDDASKPQSPTIHEVVSWYRVKYPSSAIDVIEPPVVPTAEAAYFHALHNIQQQQEPSSQSPLVLFTSTNLTVTSHVFYSCLFRTGVSDVTQSDSIYSNYNFVDYKSRKKRSNKPFSQIYQPVPFRVFPAASGLQAVGDTSRKISSEIGFWDDSAAFGEEGNSIIAPLCGRLDDLRP
uniref:Hexosyltransferase n=1 Tax=Ciona savignyi TaxID=51511 RepID=H2Y7S0_CIOSA